MEISSFMSFTCAHADDLSHRQSFKSSHTANTHEYTQTLADTTKAVGCTFLFFGILQGHKSSCAAETKLNLNLSLSVGCGCTERPVW